MLIFSSQSKADNTLASFKKAYNLLNSGDYSEAYSLFSELYSQKPDHKNADRYLFFKAKAGYYAQMYEIGINEFNGLIDKFPSSKYVPYSYFLLGNCYYRVSRPGLAIKAYLNSYKISSDKELDKLILSSIESTPVDPRSDVIEQISTASMSDNRKCDILIAAAKALIKQKNYRPIRTLLSPCGSSRAIALVDQAKQFLKQEVDIGIVLPLSGELQKFGEQILDGILLMIDRYTAETGGKLTPVLYDTGGDNLEAARIIRRLSLSGTVAAIGPLTSSETAVASAVLSCGDMPLIIPAASEGGLTELSQTSFQLQPNLDLQGIRMADFAIEWLGADTAAIITSTNTENLRMAKAFSKRFEDLGGTILGVEYFRAKETDFGPYVRDLKSLVIGELLDSIIFIDETGDTVEAEEIPVWLDCLFIPAGSNQLRQLLPQIQFYNLNTVFLGGDSWGTSKVFGLSESIIKECYFSSGIINNDKSEIFQQFGTAFDKKHGHQPGRLEALGYDAMSLICNALGSNHYTRTGIVDYISSIKDYQGAAGAITFGENRENIKLPIYTIEDGKPKKVIIEKLNR